MKDSPMASKAAASPATTRARSREHERPSSPADRETAGPRLPGATGALRPGRRRRVLVLAVALLAAAAPSRAQDEEVLSDPRLRQRLAELVPAIEETLGEPFRSAPTVELVSRRRLVSALEEEFATFHRIIRGPDAAHSAVQGHATFEAKQSAAVLLGKVLLQDDRIVVHRELVSIYARNASGVDPEVVDLLLVHEAVHVWQDQHHDLWKLFCKASKLEELQALRALTEGHAEWVTRRYAEEHELQEAWKRYRKQADTEGEENPFLKFAQVFETLVRFPYVQGERFHAAVVDAWGPDVARRRLFADPPLLLRHYQRPQEFLATAPPEAATPPARDEITLRSVELRLDPVSGARPKEATVEVWHCAPLARRELVRFDAEGSAIVRCAEGGAAYFGRISVDGHADLSRAGEAVPKDGGPVTIRAVTRAITEIVAYDAATGATIENSVAWNEERVDFDDLDDPELLVPDEHDPLAYEHGASPAFVRRNPAAAALSPTSRARNGVLSIPVPRPEATTAFVSAPGYTTARVELAETGGRPLRIALAKTSTLRVLLPDWEALVSPKITVRWLGPSSTGELALSNPVDIGAERLLGAVTARGLPSGTVIVTVASETLRSRPVYASVAVTLLPDDVQTVTIQPTWVEKPRELRIRLEIPGDFGLDSGFDARIGPTADTEDEPVDLLFARDEEGRATSTIMLLPGSYRIVLPDLGWIGRFEVTPESERVELQVPAPRRFRVRAVDGDDPVALAPSEVSLKDLPDAPSWAHWNCRARPVAEAPGQVEILVAAEAVTLSVVSKGFVPQALLGRAGPDPFTGLEARLAPGGILRVLVRAGDAPYRKGVGVWVRRESPRWSCLERSGIGGIALFKDLPPGQYRVGISVLDEVEEVPEQTVEILPRETTSVSIEFRKSESR